MSLFLGVIQFLIRCISRTSKFWGTDRKHTHPHMAVSFLGHPSSQNVPMFEPPSAASRASCQAAATALWPSTCRSCSSSRSCACAAAALSLRSPLSPAKDLAEQRGWLGATKVTINRVPGGSLGDKPAVGRTCPNGEVSRTKLQKQTQQTIPPFPRSPTNR